MQAKVDSPSSAPRTYGCPACSRCFVALGTDVAQVVFCTCGVTLVARPLPRGMYELRSSEPYDTRTTLPEKPAIVAPGADSADLGYGKSHGYGPAHGGPTGPGDAPSKPV